MSLIVRREPPPQPVRLLRNAIATWALGLFTFLIILRFGNPTAAATLMDPAWTEVLAWAVLHHRQWGSDIVFTFGPFGFLYPSASYVEGVLPLFMISQVVLSAAFAVSAGCLLAGNRILYLALFALACCAWWTRIPVEVPWPLLLVFATTLLLQLAHAKPALPFYAAASLCAFVFAVLALSKFSMFPLWLLAQVVLLFALGASRRFARVLYVLAVFELGMALAWRLAGQSLDNLLQFIASGFELAGGYTHAMGMAVPAYVELAGAAVVTCFLAVSLRLGWQNRRSVFACSAIILYALACGFAWRAFFTRGDHSPWFFAFMSFLPIAVLCNRQLLSDNLTQLAMVLIMAANIAVGCFDNPPGNGPSEFAQHLRENIRYLFTPADLASRRHAEWLAAQKAAALPRMRTIIGQRSVDMVMNNQGYILLNDLNYAPRPIFQSYVAYTPHFASINESYFLGTSAPDFVILQLASIDNHLPMADDGLALIALLRRYRPRIVEAGLILLERDGNPTRLSPIEVPVAWQTARLGETVQVSAQGATQLFIRVELNALGSLCSALLREPLMKIELSTSNGEHMTHLLARPTAASGFVFNPPIQSTRQWIDLYQQRSVPQVNSVSVDTQVSWQRMFFETKIEVATRDFDILHAADAESSKGLPDSKYPGFNRTPNVVQGINHTVVENGQDALFLHAPGQLAFELEPGAFDAEAQVGIRAAALIAPGCNEAKADGVDVAFVRLRAGRETVLKTLTINPFAKAGDMPVQRLQINDFEMASGDELLYRVSTGALGNSACDWSYVRDLRVTPHSIGQASH